MSNWVGFLTLALRVSSFFCFPLFFTFSFFLFISFFLSFYPPFQGMNLGDGLSHYMCSSKYLDLSTFQSCFFVAIFSLCPHIGDTHWLKCTTEYAMVSGAIMIK